jgi:hypothetical protein
LKFIDYKLLGLQSSRFSVDEEKGVTLFPPLNDISSEEKPHLSEEPWAIAGMGKNTQRVSRLFSFPGPQLDR